MRHFQASLGKKQSVVEAGIRWPRDLASSRTAFTAVVRSRTEHLETQALLTVQGVGHITALMFILPTVGVRNPFRWVAECGSHAR